MAEGGSSAPAHGALFTRTLGAGPDVGLIHGWGLHSAVWGETAQVLAAHHRLTLVDLPGHGRSPETAVWDLAAIADQVAGAGPPGAVWLGWSLGGLVALDLAARYPQRVRALVLVAATPRFTRAADWPWAMAPRVLEQFADDLERDYRATLQRFLGLQVRGSADARATLRRLRGLLEQAPPAASALRGGLALLRSVDLRSALGRIQCPALVVAGGGDRLVPPEAAHALAAGLPRARAEVLAGAGHAPFVSHAGPFVSLVQDFLQEVV